MKTQRGFTLLEMLIAFTLVAILFTVLFGAFTTLSKSWNAADTRMTKTEDMRLISEFLRRQLSQTLLVKISDDNDAKIYAFEGTEHSLRYVAPLQPLQHQGGLFLIELNSESAEKGLALNMRYSPYRPELTWKNALKDTEPTLIYNNLKEIKISYYGARDATKDATWETSWEQQPTPPQLIKLELTDPERTWPPLIIALPRTNDDENT